MIYGTENGADDYNIERGAERAAIWEAYEDKMAALLVASEYVDANYGPAFSGYKTSGFVQEREWPRTDAWANTRPIYFFPNNAIPVQVERATYELAYRVATGVELTADFRASDGIKKAAVEGAVSVEFHGSGTLADAQMTFTIVDRILAPLLTGSGVDSSFIGSRVRV